MPTNPPISQVMAEFARGFDQRLDALLRGMAADVPESLAEAVLYSVEGGGKRVRPFIVTRVCELCGGSRDAALAPAAALECVHAFSLVHDDLPAMDNDDLRRGRPTCHKAFGEAIAILAGDALVTLAFEILATKIADPTVTRSCVAELAAGAGWAGMIGGQTLDIQGEEELPDFELVQRIHRAKTARLFETAGRLGALAAKADKPRLEAAAEYGRKLGLAFQVADDILDVTGTAMEMGKAVAKDAQAGKQTYVAAVGLESARTAARELADEACAALQVFGQGAQDLRELVAYVVDRRK